MVKNFKPYVLWLAIWLVVSVLGSWWLAHNELDRQRDAFETDARIVHRLLSQRAVQHDAILSTLVLLAASARDNASPSHSELKLSSVYSQILAVKRRDAGAQWASPQFAAAEAQSRAAKRPVLVDADFVNGRYWLLLAADVSYALQINMRGLAPWSEWPMQPESSAVRVTIEQAGQHFVLQAGKHEDNAKGWRFDFTKHIAAESQPFDVVAVRHLGWAQLPWAWILAWIALVTAVLGGCWQACLQRSASVRHGAGQRSCCVLARLPA